MYLLVISFADQCTLPTNYHESDHVHSTLSIPSEVQGSHQLQHFPEPRPHKDTDDEGMQLQLNPAYQPLPSFPVVLNSNLHGRGVGEAAAATEMQANPSYIPLSLAVDALCDDSQ